LLISALFKWPFLEMCVCVCFYSSLLRERKGTNGTAVTFEMSRRPPSVRSAPVNAKCPSTPTINLCRRHCTHTECV
jgi:hypothetical protein